MSQGDGTTAAARPVFIGVQTLDEKPPLQISPSYGGKLKAVAVATIEPDKMLKIKEKEG